MNRKGFTLIELLVVIAIIGILSSIAIVYLSDARQKANDSKVKSNVTTASTQIELDRANGLTISEASIASTTAKLGDHPCGGDWTATNDGSANFDNVAIYSGLCTSENDGGDVFCADSQGFRGNIAASSTAADGICN